MKFFTVFITLLILSLALYGQRFSTISTVPQGVPLIYNSINLSEQIIDGSPNYNDNWKKGIVYTSSGTKFEVDSMQYNIHLRKIVFMQKGKASMFRQDLMVTQFEIDSAMFVYTSYDEGNAYDFFQVLSKGTEVTLLKRFQCDLIKGKPSNGMLPAVNDRYNTDSYYYAKANSGEIIKLKIKKDNILGVMKKRHNEVETYMKANRIKVKNEKDLVEIFDFYNTLN